MNPFHEISEEIDRFCERNMRVPDFVLVGEREWARMEQWADTCPLGIYVLKVKTGRFFVSAICGKVEAKRHPTYYSMIAPVLEEMP